MGKTDSHNSGCVSANLNGLQANGNSQVVSANGILVDVCKENDCLEIRENIG